VQLYFNNAATTLDGGIDGSQTTITVTGDPTREGTVDGFSGAASASNWQLATLVDLSDPGNYEVVKITDVTGLTFTVERGVEGTAQAWGDGTQISARLTAGAMAWVPQRHPDTSLMRFDDSAGTGRSFILGAGEMDDDTRGSNSLVLAGRSRIVDGVVLGGWSTLQHMRSFSSAASGAFDRNMAFESVGRSLPMDLGTAPDWVPDGAYYRGAVVEPTTPDGYQYWLDITSIENNSSNAGSTEPTWNNAGATVVANGNWYPTLKPVDITTGDLRDILITEVGFVAYKYDASSPPVVDIGTEADTTRFANGVTLSQITGDGTVHRIPLTTGGALVSGEGLRISVDTAAAGGRCLGFLYWKGIFIEADPGY